MEDNFDLHHDEERFAFFLWLGPDGPHHDEEPSLFDSDGSRLIALTNSKNASRSSPGSGLMALTMIINIELQRNSTKPSFTISSIFGETI